MAQRKADFMISFPAKESALAFQASVWEAGGSCKIWEKGNQVRAFGRYPVEGDDTSKLELEAVLMDASWTRVRVGAKPWKRKDWRTPTMLPADARREQSDGLNAGLLDAILRTWSRQQSIPPSRAPSSLWSKVNIGLLRGLVAGGLAAATVGALSLAVRSVLRTVRAVRDPQVFRDSVGRKVLVFISEEEADEMAQKLEDAGGVASIAGSALVIEREPRGV